MPTFNAVHGFTVGGSLTLSQVATAGSGGGSDTGKGGKGGAATSDLTFNDTLKAAEESANLTATAWAQGGAGGAEPTAALGGIGGAATASLILTGAGNVNGASNAYGGAGESGAPRTLPPT